MRRHSFGRFNFPPVTLSVVEGERMKLKASLFRNRGSSCGIDSPAKENNRPFACHKRRLGDFRSFHRIAFFVPADNSLVENFHVAVTLFIQNAIGQTGQVMRAGSIEDNQAILGNVF